MSKRLQIRRDTEANWQSVNPVLLQGEIGFVLDDNGNVVGKKVGNGKDAWDALEYYPLGIADGTITMAKLAEEVQEAISAGGTGSIADGSVTRAKLDEQVGGVVDNAEELFTEYETENLAVITSVGKYIDANGNWNVGTPAGAFNSSLIHLEPGETYYIKQQFSYNNIRVFKKSSEGTYTQVTHKQAQTWKYTVPTDGQDYWLQLVEAVVTFSTGTPLANPDEKMWVSKGKLLLEYVEPLRKSTSEEIREQKYIKPKKSIRLLAIGNSYSRDALSYLPYVLSNIAPEIDITIGILYRGSCTLATHYDLLSNNKEYEAFDFWSSEKGVWTSTTENANISYVMRDTVPWDIVTLQQQSSASRDYSTYQPYLNDIIDIIIKKTLTQKTPIKIGWLLTPSYWSNNSNLGEDTSDTMFNKICDAVETLMSSTAVDFFIPCGTAIQNARTTDLKDLGATGGLMADTLHLQEGLPCLIEAWTAALKICELAGVSNKGIYGEPTTVDAESLTAWNVQQQNGTVVTITTENKIKAYKCVSMAMKKPLEITTIDF